MSYYFLFRLSAVLAGEYPEGLTADEIRQKLITDNPNIDQGIIAVYTDLDFARNDLQKYAENARTYRSQRDGKWYIDIQYYAIYGYAEIDILINPLSALGE